MLQALKEKPKILGVTCVMLAVFIFSVVNLVVKDTGNNYPITQTLLFRFSCALIPLLFLMRKDLSRKAVIPNKIGLCIFSGFVLCLMLGLLFTALKTLPLADTQALSFSSSLFVTALAMPLIGEKVGIHRWISVVIGFVGVLIVVQPSTDLIRIGALMALLSSLCQAIILLYARVILRKDKPVTMTLFINVVATLIVMPFALFQWEPMTNRDLLMLIFMGAGSGFAQFMITLGYKYAEASFLSPFLYSALIWGILFDLFIYGHLPSLAMLLGSAIIIVSSLYIVVREQRQAKKSV